jgi:FkbM family methyltransferase
MTTIPSRIEFIEPVIEAALSQSQPVDSIEINIPYYCIRTRQQYTLPLWLENMDRVRIFRTEDFGAITKVAPTLIRHMDDPDVYIWSIDDDCAMPPDQLALTLRAFNEREPRILARYGGGLYRGETRNWIGEGYITFFEGFGGILYPPRCIKSGFQEYVESTSRNDDCRKSDDIVLSMYFNRIRFPIYLFNKPNLETPYMVEGWLAHKKTDNLLGSGHTGKYKRVFKFVSELYGDLLPRNIVVRAVHPDWVGLLELDPQDKTVFHVDHHSRGRYDLTNDKLTIGWEKYAQDIFLQVADDVFISDKCNKIDARKIKSAFVGKKQFFVEKIAIRIHPSQHQVFIRTLSTDMDAFHQVFVNYEYQSKDLPESVGTIVDLGANAGYASVFFALKYANAKIVAVEPDLNNFHLLQENTRSFGDRIVQVQGAVWIDDGFVGLKTDTDDGVPMGDWGIQVSKDVDVTMERVQSYRLRTILESAGFDRIGILKVDIEGAELELFSQDYEEWLPVTDMIIIETHDRFRPGSEAAVRSALANDFEELAQSGENLVFRRKGR